MKIKKLRIELEGKPITPLLKIFADGKQLGRVSYLKITANDDDILVDVEVMQSKVVKVDGKDTVIKEPVKLEWGN